MTRLFDAPRHLVFEAMTQARARQAMVGPLGDGYSVPVCEVDLVRAARGASSAAARRASRVHGVYREIAPPERLVFTEIFEPFPDTESVVTAVFTEENGKTRLTVTASIRRWTSATW